MHQISPRIAFLFILLSMNFGRLFACVYTANIVSNPNTAVCPGTAVSLTADGSSGAFTYTYDWSNGSTTAAINVTPGATTNYTVTVTNNLGCTVSATATVTVNPNPTATITPATISICSGQSTNLTAGGGGTYKWSTNATTATIAVSPTTTISYTVTVTNASNCTATVSRVVTVNPVPVAKITATGTTLSQLFNGYTTFYKCAQGAQNSTTFTFLNGSTGANTYTIIWGDTAAPLPIAGSWTTQTHIYALGYYTLTFIAIANGCSDTTVYKVFFGSTPEGNIGNPGNLTGCYPATFTFPINNASNNPPGTIYTIGFTDGSPSLTFTDSVPISITHSFSSSSCGTNYVYNSNTYQNAYSVSFLAENPCGTSGNPIGPIYISEPTHTNFSMSPAGPVCVNTPVTVVDSSTGDDIVITGSFTSYCDTTPPLLWSIFPLSGWTITGSLGNSNGYVGGNYAPYSWTSGTKSLQINFTSPGTYSIMDVSGNSCGPDTMIKTICIQRQPVVNFTLPSANHCLPVTVTPNCAVNDTPVCGTYNYDWTVSYSNPLGCNPTGGNWSFTSGSATSLDPTFSFQDAGYYTVQLTVTTANNVCPSGSFSSVDTVRTKPLVTINPISAICVGQTIDPTTAVTDCYSTTTPTYSWSFPGGNPTTSTSATPAVTYSTSGTYTVSDSVRNECGVTTATTTVSVISNPTVTMPHNDTVCINSAAFQLSATPTGGTWSGSISVTSGGMFTPSAVGTNSLTYNVGIGGCSGSGTMVVVVNALPNVSVTQPASPICVGSSVSLTGSSTSGPANYTWSPATGLNTTNGATVIASPATTTTYTVTCSNLLTGCTNTATSTVTVNPLPVVNAGSNITLCNQPIKDTLTGFSPTTGGTGIWSGTGVTSTGVFTPSGVGNFVLTYTFTNTNGCVNKDSIVVSVVNPQTANAGNGFNICVNAPVHTLTGFSPAGGTWSGTGVTGNTFNPVGLNGLYILTYTFGTGTCLSSDTIHVTVNPQPTISVNSPTTCSGVPASLTATGTSNTYSWSPSTGLSATTGATVNATDPTANTSYTVTGTINATGCTNSATATITVNPLPVVNAGSNISLCNQPIKDTLTGFSPTTGGTGVWSGTGVTSAGIFTPSTVGSFVLIYTFTNTNGCVNKDSITVTVVNPQVANAGTGFSICVNASVHNLTGFSPAGGTWSGTGVTGNTFNPAGLNGLYVLTYTYGTGTCLSSDTIHVTVNPQPTISVNSPTTCSGVLVSLTATGTSNTYSWSPSAGLSATTGATVSVTDPTGNTSYTVTGTITVTGCNNTATSTITVNPLPVVNAGSNISLCNQPIKDTLTGFSPTTGGTGVWSGTGVTGAGIFTPSAVGSFVLTYTFTNTDGCVNKDSITVTVVNPQVANAGNGFSICVNAPSHTLTGFSPAGGTWSGTGVTGNTFNPAGLNGLYVLTYTYGTGTCLSSDTIHVTVNPQPTISVNSPTTCSGVPVSLSATGTSNTYSWSPSTGLSATTGATVSATDPTANTSYTVTGTITSTGCSNTATSSITVNPLPVVNAGSNISLCNQPIKDTLTGFSPTTGGTGVWSGTGVTSAGIFTPSNVGSFVLTYIFTNTNGCISKDSITVTVVAPQIANAGTGFGICVDAPVHTLTGFSPAGGTWSGTGVTGNTFNPAGLNGLYILTYSYGTGTCLSQDTIHVIVNPQPTISVNSPTTCWGVSVVLTATGNSTSYSWAPATGLSATTGATVNATDPTANTSYTVTGTINATGCTNSATATITVNPLPVVNAGSNITLCNQPIRDTLTGFSPTAGGTGVWSGTGVTSAGIFTPSTVGSFVLIYTFTNTNGCINNDSIVVTVVAPQIANAGAGFGICVNAPVHTLTGFSPAGGTWSGTGVTGNTFNPAGLNGLYILTYSYGTGTCLSQDTIHVFVNPQPTVAVTSPTTCWGVPVSLTASGNSTAYSWAPTTGLSATTGATVSVTDPTSNTNYTVTGTITATGCTNTATSTITVNPLPVVNAGSNITLCNQPIKDTLTGFSPTLGGTGVWSGTGVSSAGVFTPSSIGNFVLTYTFTNTNGCINSDSITVTVVAPQIANAGAGFGICVDAPVHTLTGFSPMGGTWIGTGVTGNTFNPAGLNGLYILTYSYGTGTCLSQDTIHVFVNALPVITLTPSVASICINDSVTLTASGANKYAWTPNTTLTASTGQTVIAFPLDTTTYTVTGTDTITGCVNTNTVTVDIKPRPVINAINEHICSDSVNAVITQQSNLNGTTYTWNGVSPGGLITGFTTPGTGNIQSFALVDGDSVPGMVVFTVLPTTNGCSGLNVNDTIFVNPTPNVTFSDTNQLICSGAHSIEVSFHSDVTGTSFNWSSSAPPSITGNTPNGNYDSIPVQILVNHDSLQHTVTYTVVPVAGGCPGPQVSYTIKVNPAPVTLFSDTNQVLCSGSSSVLVHLSSTTPGATFTWSVHPIAGLGGLITSGTSSIPQQTLIDSLTAPIIINYIALATTPNAGCPGPLDTFKITVNPIPLIFSSTHVDTICSGITIHDTLSSNVIGTTFSWIVHAPASITGDTAGSGSVIVQTLHNSSTSAQTVMYITTPNATNCPGIPDTVTYIVNPSPVIIFTPVVNQMICDSDTTALVVITSTTNSGVTFSWSAVQPAGITGVALAGIDTIPVQILTNSTDSIVSITYNARATYDGCTGANFPYIIQVNPLAFINPLQAATLCSDSLSKPIPLSSTVQGTPTNYSWTAFSPNNIVTGFAASGSGDTIQSFVPVNNDSITGEIIFSVTPAVNHCAGIMGYDTLWVSPTPKISFLDTNQTICSNASSDVVHIISNVANSTFSWNASSTSTLVTGFTPSGTGDSIPVQPIRNTDTVPHVVTYAVVALSAGCPGAPTVYQITVNPAPITTFSDTDQIICSTSSSVQVNLQSTTPNAVFSWTAISPSGIITGVDTSGTNAIPPQTLTISVDTSVTIHYIAFATTSTAGCPGPPATYTIKVNPVPVVTVTNIKDTICSLDTAQITLTSDVVGTTFAWTVTQGPDISGDSAGSGAVITQALTNSGSVSEIVIYRITPLASNCPGTIVPDTIIVNPSPSITFTPDSPQTICSGYPTVAVTLGSPTSGTIITWTSNPPSVITGVDTSGTTQIPIQTLFSDTNVPTTVTYVARASFDGCIGHNNTYNIIVDPKPVILDTNTFQHVCSGDSTQAIVLVSSVINTTFSWYTTGNASLTNYVTQGTAATIPAQVITANNHIPDTLRYVATPEVNGCFGDSVIFTLVVYPTPTITVSPDSQILCSGDITQVILATTSVAGSTIVWVGTAVFVSGFIDSGTANPIPAQIVFNTSPMADTGWLTYTVSPFANGCPGPSVNSVIGVLAKPIPNINPSVTSGCGPLWVTFEANDSVWGNPFYLAINWGDGSPNDTIFPRSIEPIWPDVVHRFANLTDSIVTYTVMCIGSNNCGTDTSIKHITVLPDSIEAFFKTSDSAGCAPLTETFTEISTGSTNSSWCFNFNDSAYICTSGSALDTTPNSVVNYTFTVPGVYTVALFISNGCASDEAFQQITVHPSPQTAFSFNNNVCADAPVNFTNLSVTVPGSIVTSYFWNFGDSTTSYLASPSHLFDTVGVYNVCLSVTSSTFGCADTLCKPVTILNKPFAAFTVANECLNHQPVQMINNSIGAISWFWNFGDGNTAIDSNPSHFYAGPGIDTITLIVGTLSCFDTTSRNDTIFPIPTALFTIDSTYFCGVPQLVRLNNTSTGASGYTWSFGNGTSSNLVNPVADYTTSGTFIVQLIAENFPYNCTDTAYDSVIIYPYPALQNIEVQPAEGCQPQLVTLTVNATYANNFVWNFGDGSALFDTTSAVVSHLYIDTGTYSLNVQIYSYQSCNIQVSLPDTVTVHVTPVAAFSHYQNVSTYPVDGTVIFTNHSQNANTYTWNFGDGTPLVYDTNPVHKYEYPDTFQVTLIAATNFGCLDTATDTFFVMRKVLYAPNALAPEWGGGVEAVKEWLPVGIGLREYHAQVFDKWGELLWESDSLVNTKPAVGWDGTYQGKLCQEDVYVWKIYAVFLDGTLWPGMSYDKDEGGGRKTVGSITLIR